MNSHCNSHVATDVLQTITTQLQAIAKVRIKQQIIPDIVACVTWGIKWAEYYNKYWRLYKGK